MTVPVALSFSKLKAIYLHLVHTDALRNRHGSVCGNGIIVTVH